MEELKVYVINIDNVENENFPITNEEFIEEAKKQKSIYSLKDFEQAFNWDEINSFTQVIKIL